VAGLAAIGMLVLVAWLSGAGVGAGGGGHDGSVVRSAPGPAAGAAVPAGARGVVSATLGRHDPRYAISGRVARNPAQRLHLRFAPSGATVTSGQARMRLALAAVGRGHVGKPVVPARLTRHANRVDLHHGGGVDEWFVNGPGGLEQGFGIAQRPAGGQGPMKLSLALGAGTRVRLQDGSAMLSAGGEMLRYSGLTVRDARGKSLRSSLAVDRGRLQIRVDDRDARYPLTVDPVLQQATLTPSVGNANERFGATVAVSGSTIVVGAPFRDASHIGAAYVFGRTAGAWGQIAELAAPADGGYGRAVAVSGNAIAVESPSDQTGGNTSGTIYFYTRSGDTVQAAGDLPVDNGTIPATDVPGGPLAMSGNTLVAGEPNATHATVFTLSGSGWAQTATLTPPAGTTGAFGSSVAIDGGTAVVGARTEGASMSTPAQGGAYVFTGGGASWAQTAHLTPPPTMSAQTFGSGVAVSGSTVAVGDSQVSAVFMFVGGVQQARIAPADTTTNDQFGATVALQGGNLFASAPNAVADADAGTGTGAVYGFTGAGATWTQTSKTYNPVAGQNLGGGQYSVPLAASGTTFVFSATEQKVGDNDREGTAFVFGTPSTGLSGAVLNEVCGENSCSQPGLPGQKVLVKGTADDGSAFSQVTTSGADGAWEVDAPAGKYEVGPVLDDGATSVGPAFDPISRSVTVGDTAVTGQDFHTCTVPEEGSQKALASERRAAAGVASRREGSPTPSACKSIYKLEISAKIPQHELVDPSTKAAFEEHGHGGYNPRTYKKKPLSPEYPACFSPERVHKYADEHARARYYTTIKGGKLGSVTLSVAWDRKAQEVHVVSGPVEKPVRVTRVYHWRVDQKKGGKSKHGTCEEKVVAPMLTLAAGGADLPKSDMTGRRFAIAITWPFPFEPEGFQVDPNTIVEKTRGVLRALYHPVVLYDEAIEGLVHGFASMLPFKTPKIVRYGLEFGASFLIGGKAVKLLGKAPAALEASLEGSKYLPAALAATETTAEASHYAHDANSFRELIGIGSSYMKSGEYPVMGAIIRGTFKLGNYHNDAGVIVADHSTLALNVKTTNFPTITMKVSRAAAATIDPENPAFNGLIPWHSGGTPNRQFTNLLNKNPAYTVTDAAARKYGVGLHGVHKVHHDTSQLPKLTESVEEHKEEGTEFESEFKEAKEPACDAFAQPIAGTGTDFCYLFKDGRP
jgi:hypothetical protein